MTTILGVEQLEGEDVQVAVKVGEVVVGVLDCANITRLVTVAEGT